MSDCGEGGGGIRDEGESGGGEENEGGGGDKERGLKKESITRANVRGCEREDIKKRCMRA